MDRISQEARQRMTEGVKSWGLQQRLKHSELKEKHCKGCDKTKSTEKFSKRSSKGISLPRSRCKECEALSTKQYTAKRRKEASEIIRERKREWARKNPQSVQRTTRRKFLRKIGVEHIEDTLLWLESLPKICSICGLHEHEHHQKLAVDHCHKTNKIRGLLCSNCNQGLGKFQDDVNLLEKAKEYLLDNRTLIC